jgi:nicotinate-nucleotide adenylyltransferase
VDVVAPEAAKRWGIFGGTFDPPHRGHLQVANHAWRQLKLTQVLFIPAGDPPHKQGRTITPAAHRVAMLGLALQNQTHFKVSLVDVTRPGPHYSIDTLRLVQSAHAITPEHCFFIIGADSLADLPTWHQPERLLSLCQLVVAPRPGYKPDMAALQAQFPGLSQRLLWLNMPPVALAATDLRHGREGQSMAEAVLPAVAAYMAQHQLYPANKQTLP